MHPTPSKLTADFDGRSNLHQHGLGQEGLARVDAQHAHLGLGQVDCLARAAAAHCTMVVETLGVERAMRFRIVAVIRTACRESARAGQCGNGMCRPGVRYGTLPHRQLDRAAHVCGRPAESRDFTQK